MLKDIIVKGLLLGIMAGQLTTLFDSLFMLIPNLYVPYSYPLLLIIFNTLFWMIVGGLSGLTLWAFVRKKEHRQEKENFYWVLLFLLPFTLLYGLLGRLFIPFSDFLRHASNVYDYHLSFIWVLLILVFLIFYFKKIGHKREFPSIFFAFEIVTFILLFQFCSNLLYIKKITGFYFKYQNFFQEIKLERVQFLIAVYIVGVLSIVGFYFIIHFKIRPLIKGKLVTSNYFPIVILFLIASGCLTSFFTWNYKSHIKKNFLPITASENKEERKVSHIILIVLDTVRADRLSLYGNLGTSKNLEEFSRDALVFENCVASSSWTLPSHASLFTGLYPTEHGSHGNLNAKLPKRIVGGPPPRPLSEKFLTLAEIFRDNGYKTAAVVSNCGALHSGLKINQGFQIYDCILNIGTVYVSYPFRPILHLFCYITHIYPKYLLPYRSADDINKESLHLLDKLAPSPFFLFINYMDAHGPYCPPRPFDGYFLNTSFPKLHRLWQNSLRFIIKLKKESWHAYQLSQYDGEIAFLDDQLGKFFSCLKQMRLYDSSLIIITSDHGELFGEHGMYGHQKELYEGVVRVPLLIKFPFSEKVGREKRMISLVDLYPTILSICDLSMPTGISGKAFGDASSSVVSELYQFLIEEHRILYDGKYKYMRYKHEKGPELYDLDKDPMEKDNLSEKLPEVTLAMEEKLKDWEKVHRPKYTSSGEGEETSPKEVLENLRALGYIQ